MKQNKLFKLWLLAVILFAGSGVTWGQTYLINEGFESTTFPPTGWTNSSSGTIRSTNSFRTGSASLCFNGANDAIYTPQISNPNQLSFWYRRSTNTTAWTLNVQVSTDASNWTSIGTITDASTTYQEFTYDLSSYSNIYVRMLDQRSSGSNERYVDDFTVTAKTSSTPTITITETSLSGFTYVQGSGPSAEQTFKLSGSNLTNDISVSAPTNYEISKTTGSGWGTPLTFTQSGGNVTEQTVYVRLKAGLSEGSYNNETINISSTGATSKTVTCNGSVTSQPVTPEVSIALTSGSNPACAGSSVSFTASPSNTGGGTVSYQWKVNGNNTGTNNAVFTSSTLQNNDQISCVINITGGNVTTNTAASNSITMTVNALPTTPVAVNNGPVCVGSTLQLTSNATGTISWTGPNGFTSTQQNPEITNVTAAAAGTYYVTSNNGTCTSLAGSTVVAINAATSITTQPANATVTVGSSKTFSVVATGTGLSYQWKLNGNNITNATGDSYTVSNVTLAMSGNVYSVVVTGDCGSPVISDNATLTVVELPCGGTESFTNSSISASYSSGSFTGDVVLWSYVYSRNEESFGITGKGCMFGPSNTAKLTSGSLSGIGNFTCKLKKGFTGLGTRQVGLYINGELKGNSIAWDNTTTQTFTVNNINVAGNVVIEIRNLTSYQVVVDDISWTCYAPPVAPVAKDALNVTTTSFDANWNAVSGATIYKLDVANQSNFTTDVTLIDENFVNFTGTGTSVTVLDNYMNLTGWAGSQVYTYSGAARLGSSSNRGILTTPTIDLSNAESIKLTFDLQQYDASTIEILHAADGSTFNPVTSIVSPSAMTTQTVYITGGTINSKIRIQGSASADQRFYLDNFKIVKTASNCLAGYNNLNVNNLTKSVSGLTNHTTYYYRVRAEGANGTSVNSNIIMVYTGENYRSKTNGNWNDVGTWEVSSDNNTWVDATEIPSSTSATVTVLENQKVEILSNANVNSLVVKPLGKLTLKNNYTLGAQNMFIQSDNNGTGTFIDENINGGLTLTGNAIVNQYLITDRNWYLSSPVSAAAVPGAQNVWYYDETVIDADPMASWINPSGNLEVGKGYIVNPTGAAVTVQFNGTLNTGEKSIGLTRTVGATKEGFNLVGNPYPSYITWLESTATAANVEPSIWYRTHNGSGYEFQTYNAPSGVGVPSSASGYIPPMQAFWVRVKPTQTSGTLTFTNALRLHNDGTFSSLKAPAAKNSDRQLIRLQVSNGSTSDELVVYSNANASNGFDAYDSPKMLNGSTSAVPDMYTTAGSEKLVINGLNTLPLDVVIPVSFAANNASATSFTISANEISNLPSGVTVKVVDNNVETSLSDGGTYTFTANSGTTKTFGLVLRSPGFTTDVSNNSNNQFSVFVNANGKVLVNLNEKLNENTFISIFNAVGQQITRQQITATTAEVNQALIPGVYLVQLNNGKISLTSKVIVR